MHIPYYNLQKTSEVSEIAVEGLKHRLVAGKFMGGMDVPNLELAFMEFFRRRHAIAVGSCSEAIYMALKSLNIQDRPHDYIAISSFSHPAALWACERLNVKPYFLDVNDDYEMVIPTKWPHEINPPIAMVITHLFGFAQDLTPIHQLNSEYSNRMILVEDAAQAFGATYPGTGEMVGNSGTNATCFSFDPTKRFSSIGNGGMILTDSGFINRHAREMAEISRSQITDLEAELLLYQFRNPNRFEMEDYKNIYQTYQARLENIPEITTFQKNTKGSWPNKYVIRLPSEKDRDGLKSFLRGRNIETKIHYGQALCAPWILTDCSYTMDYNSYKLAKTCLSLPFHCWLSQEEISQITNSIQDYFQ
jgi:dTDP-4-amino-4,6-dideoxygalactose transaminase